MRLGLARPRSHGCLVTEQGLELRISVESAVLPATTHRFLSLNVPAMWRAVQSLGL